MVVHILQAKGPLQVGRMPNQNMAMMAGAGPANTGMQGQMGMNANPRQMSNVMVSVLPHVLYSSLFRQSSGCVFRLLNRTGELVKTEIDVDTDSRKHTRLWRKHN